MSSSRRPSHQTHLKEAKDLEEQLSRKTQEALRQKKDYEAELAKKDAEIKTLKEEILVLQIENAVLNEAIKEIADVVNPKQEEE
ncbi:unnamed protein product [Fusarium langsethiae]|nr:unnamed protein product [Fusarium langsethiae]